jgi:hypothetical protein
MMIERNRLFTSCIVVIEINQEEFCYRWTQSIVGDAIMFTWTHHRGCARFCFKWATPVMLSQYLHFVTNCTAFQVEGMIAVRTLSTPRQPWNYHDLFSVRVSIVMRWLYYHEATSSRSHEALIRSGYMLNPSATGHNWWLVLFRLMSAVLTLTVLAIWMLSLKYDRSSGLLSKTAVANRHNADIRLQKLTSCVQMTQR